MDGREEEEKKSSYNLTLRDTELHKTHPWVQRTPFMIYITIRNQRSCSVKNVILGLKEFMCLFSTGLGIDGERVNGNVAFKRSFLT